MSAYQNEKDMATKREVQSDHSADLERTQTVYDDNFHGLTLKTILVYLVRDFFHMIFVRVL